MAAYRRKECNSYPSRSHAHPIYKMYALRTTFPHEKIRETFFFLRRNASMHLVFASASTAAVTLLCSAVTCEAENFQQNFPYFSSIAYLYSLYIVYTYEMCHVYNKIRWRQIGPPEIRSTYGGGCSDLCKYVCMLTVHHNLSSGRISFILDCIGCACLCNVASHSLESSASGSRLLCCYWPENFLP